MRLEIKVSSEKASESALGEIPNRIFFVLPYRPRLTTRAFRIPMMSSSFNRPLTLL